MSGKRYPSWFDYVVSTALLASAVLALVFGVAGLLSSDYSESFRFIYVLLAGILLLYDVIQRRHAEEKLRQKEMKLDKAVFGIDIGENDG